MRVSEAIEQYLSAQRRRGLEGSSVRTTGHGLRTVLAPVINDPVADLAAVGVGETLRTALAQRRSRTSKKMLTPTTRELYLNAAKAFLTWCVLQGWLKSSPLAPAQAVPPGEPHIGQIVRRLRIAARMTQWAFGEQVRLSEATVKALELGLFRPTRTQLDKLLTSPSMADLLAMAERCRRARSSSAKSARSIAALQRVLEGQVV